MEIQIIADLYLENPKVYDIYDIVPKAPYLALLGDIGNIVAHEDDYYEFLTRQLKQFRVVFLVAGNHEPYHASWPEALEIFHYFEDRVRKDSSIGEFVFLDRRAYQLPDTNVVILGCSLFSFVPSERQNDVSMGLNDFYQTDEWTVIKHNEAHQRDLAWLNDQVAELENSDVSVMIFTHWSPSIDSRAIDPRHLGSSITSAFSTDTSKEICFRSDKVKLWAFGHTHYNCDFVVERGDGAGPLRLLANQRGYYFA
ncbi:Metallo-dependent phosphatase-like protein [Thelonectria olida]|uniref:Metallo-dependent phosphatase-like protein n=1 Tax=Thelonectria olida TaxID=1576542 RepID=A0A9P8VZY4_9HYPO|nr:Metallo-dependent phosphatase-like protein [Thelonectria olida]